MQGSPPSGGDGQHQVKDKLGTYMDVIQWMQHCQQPSRFGKKDGNFQRRNGGCYSFSSGQRVVNQIYFNEEIKPHVIDKLEVEVKFDWAKGRP